MFLLNIGVIKAVQDIIMRLDIFASLCKENVNGAFCVSDLPLFDWR